MDIGRYTLSAREPDRCGRSERAQLTRLRREVAAFCHSHAPFTRRQIRELETTLIVAQRVDEELVVRPLNLGSANRCVVRRVEDASDDGAVAGALGARRASRLC